MSGWGATERGGEPISAWEYRELYLEYGERYSEFFCPFCDIPLVAMLIYTDEELSQRLKISRRSLQDYRNQGRIPYIKLGGKILYRSSDIERMLEEGYRNEFR